MRRDLLILIGCVLLLRLPFLSQAVQGDDVYYLMFARNALVDPLHPLQMGFRLQGELVWAAGHTRPPLNAYILAGLLAVFGEVRETAFHLFYALFSVAAAAGAYFLARRFTARPLLAAFVFAAAPAFVVNGNKLEADLPLLSLWLGGFALFVHNRFRWAAAVMALAGLASYQTSFAVPILAWRAWRQARRNWTAWGAVLAAPAAVSSWQLWETATAGTVPAGVLAGYFSTYGLLELERKLFSTAALMGHLGWIVSPVLVVRACAGAPRRGWLLAGASFAAALPLALLLQGYTAPERLLLWASLGAGLTVLAGCGFLAFRGPSEADRFLSVWVLVFFAGAVAVFYAGSARYLLPVAAPAALLVVRRVNSKAWLVGATVPHLALSLGLAWADFEYVNQYRGFARELAPRVQGKRLWHNAEWGLRYYLGELGGEPLLDGQEVYAGSVVAESELAEQTGYRATGARRRLLHREVTTQTVPVRLIGLGSRSGYSSSEFGVLPFDPGHGVIDRVTAWGVGMGEARLPYLSMADPQSGEQLLWGFYQQEAERWRWMAKEGAALLKASPEVSGFVFEFHIPRESPARRVTVFLEGRKLVSQSYSGDGGYTLRAPVQFTESKPVQVRVAVDRAFEPPGEGRELGVVVLGLGFR